ncbi:MAG: ShlB/FhaC/HecB family hemolysin secretion/activation protein [Sphingomonas sp.]
MRVWFGRAALILPSLLLDGEAVAQQAPPVPSQADQAVPRRDQVEPSTEPRTTPQSTVSVDTRGAIVQPPCALESSPIRATLRSVSFQTPNGQPIAPALQQLLAGITTGPPGEQPIAVVCKIRDEVNEALSQAGYVALAQIPAQDISSGDLKLTIVSARIVEVRILGKLGPFKHVIESRIEAIRRLDPLNRRAAERILLQAGDIPGVDVRLALRAAGPGSNAGDVIGELSVETQQMQVLANAQNFGSSQLGPIIVSARAEAYGLTGLADRTYFAYSNSTDWNEIHVVQAGHDFALNSSGLRAAIRSSFALSQPDIPNLDLRSRSTIVGFELSQQLARRVDRQLTSTLGFEVLDQRTQIYQSGARIPFTRDRMRVAFARLDGDATFLAPLGTPVAIVSGYAELRRGLSIFGASQIGTSQDGYPPSRFEGDPEAMVVRGEFNVELRPLAFFSIATQAFGQWSNHALLNLEEFSLGNFTYGRGYDPGSNGGDRAYAFRVEPRVKLPLGLPFDVQLTGFYDSVRLWNLDQGATEKNRLLRSVGGGVRLLVSGAFVLDAIYAHPLDRVLLTDTKKPDDRFLISLTTRLFPFFWGRH